MGSEGCLFGGDKVKLSELVEYLVEPQRLSEICSDPFPAEEKDVVLIYMKERLDLNSDIRLFRIRDTEDEISYEKNGTRYLQLFPLEHAISLIESDLNLKNRGYPNSKIAEALLEYRIFDA